MMNDEISNICRLCAIAKDRIFQIYDEEGYKLAIGIKINKYLQIQVDEKDSLPKNVCWDCYSKLEDYSSFVDSSQNAQITLTEKIITLYTKDDNVFSQNSLFQQTSNMLNYDSRELEKNDACNQAATFDCDDINLSTSDMNCYYNEKSTYCIYQTETDKTVEPIPQILAEEIPAENNLSNSEDCNQTEFPRRVSRRKCNVPVRYLTTNNIMFQINMRRRLKRGAKVSAGIKKSVAKNLDDFDEDESESFKEKYFNDIPWMCSNCDQHFPTLAELREHQTTYHNEQLQFICPHCYKIYQTYAYFVMHVRRVECSVEFVCEYCSKSFTSKRLFDLHSRTHGKKTYDCRDCGKSFKYHNSFTAHSKLHLTKEERQSYPCDQCDKWFSSKQNLTTHKKIHTGVRSYMCDLCGKGFVQKGNLGAHMLTHSNQKPFTCVTCNKEFKTSIHLRKHNDIHSDKKPHQCDFCGKTFRERRTLKEHYRIHTGDTPFSCEFCGKSFRFKGVLVTHRRQHTGERPYSCTECQHHFTNWPNYNKHMKRRHGINKSRANRIKSDNAVQNARTLEENVAPTTVADIEIPSFEDALQSIPVVEADKSVRLFDDTAADSFLLSHHAAAFGNNIIESSQNSILNAYFNMTSLHATNSPSHGTVDLMTATDLHL